MGKKDVLMVEESRARTEGMANLPRVHCLWRRSPPLSALVLPTFPRSTPATSSSSTPTAIFLLIISFSPNNNDDAQLFLRDENSLLGRGGRAHISTLPVKMFELG